MFIHAMCEVPPQFSLAANRCTCRAEDGALHRIWAVLIQHCDELCVVERKLPVTFGGLGYAANRSFGATGQESQLLFARCLAWAAGVGSLELRGYLDSQLGQMSVERVTRPGQGLGRSVVVGTPQQFVERRGALVVRLADLCFSPPPVVEVTL